MTGVNIRLHSKDINYPPPVEGNRHRNGFEVGRESCRARKIGCWNCQIQRTSYSEKFQPTKTMCTPKDEVIFPEGSGMEEWEKEMLSIPRYGRQWLNMYVISEENYQKTTQVKRLRVKVARSCPTLWAAMDSTVHGILQAKILEWVAFLYSRGSSQPRDRTQVSHIAGRFFTS